MLLQIATNVPAGLYRLSKNVVNPCPDGRTRDRWPTATRWDAGRYFRISDSTPDESDPRVSVTIYSGPYHSVYGGLRKLDEDQRATDTAVWGKHEHCEQSIALLPHLEPVPVTADTIEYLHPHLRDTHAPSVLQEMARRGLITNSQALSVLTELAAYRFLPDCE